MTAPEPKRMGQPPKPSADRAPERGRRADARYSVRMPAALSASLEQEAAERGGLSVNALIVLVLTERYVRRARAR